MYLVRCLNCGLDFWLTDADMISPLVTCPTCDFSMEYNVGIKIDVPNIKMTSTITSLPSE